MVEINININERMNHVLNFVKEKYGFKDSSQAIEFIIEQYESNLIEPELRPEYIEKLEKIRKGKYKRYSSIKELKKATN